MTFFAKPQLDAANIYFTPFLLNTYLSLSEQPQGPFLIFRLIYLNLSQKVLPKMLYVGHFI